VISEKDISVVVSDIAIFVLKRDIKLQLTNISVVCIASISHSAFTIVGVQIVTVVTSVEHK